MVLANKLQSILLTDADFNIHNKIVTGKRMLDMARQEGIIPLEQYSDK